MPQSYCVTYDPDELKRVGAPADLAEQLQNKRGTLVRDSSQEVLAVFQRNWDEALDGPWPPRGDRILRGFPR